MDKSEVGATPHQDISKEVMSHLNRCSELVGRNERDGFSQMVWHYDGSCEIESPLEQLLFTSLLACILLFYFESEEIDIRLQKTIESYRVDFFITGYVKCKPIDKPCPAIDSEGKRSVIVECDSQQWHERSERERRYEKRRDRVMASIRFTGKEIKEDPFKCAAEVLQVITGRDLSDYQDTIDLYSEEPFESQ